TTEEAIAPQRPPLRRRVAGWLAGAVTSAWNKTTAGARRAWVGIRSAPWGGCNRVGAGGRDGGCGARTRGPPAFRGAGALRHGGWLGALALGQLARRQARPTLLALGVGVAVGTSSYLAGPAVASVVSGLASMTLTLATWGLLPLAQLLSPSPNDAA